MRAGHLWLTNLAERLYQWHKSMDYCVPFLLDGWEVKMKAHSTRITLKNQRTRKMVIVQHTYAVSGSHNFLLKQHLLKCCRIKMDEPVISMTTSQVRFYQKNALFSKATTCASQLVDLDL